MADGNLREHPKSQSLRDFVAKLALQITTALVDGQSISKNLGGLLFVHMKIPSSGIRGSIDKAGCGSWLGVHLHGAGT